jgi:prepilin-type N-terminal cleavage/methylation domain
MQNKGFTLIEILVAVVIMGLAYVAILQSFSLSSRNIAHLDKERTSLLVNSQNFEQQLLTPEQLNNGAADSGDDVMVSGALYQLSLIASKNNTFMTLKLDKK